MKFIIQRKPLFGLCLALFLLSGCGAGAVSKKTENADEQIHWNPQQYAGMTHVVVGYNKDGSVRDVSWWDGISGPTFQTKRTKSPSCMHDAIYWLIRNGHLPFSTWQVADHEFKRMCIEKGIFRIRAWWLYRGLSFAHGVAALPSHKKKILTAP